MKKLLTLLFLLIASPAWATYFHVSDCASIPGPEEADVCAQLTTTIDRTSGHLYIYRSAAWVDVDSAGTGAPTNTTYITQTPDGALSNEQALSTLSTGIVKNSTGTGVLSIASPGTDYVAPTGSGAGLTALNASELGSGTAPTARLGSGTANNTTFLRGDNTWAAPTVSALSANGANCSAGNAPLGVDAAGAAEGCFDVATQVELNTHSALTGTGAHGATTTNTANMIPVRDGSGNFAAGTITAALTGNVTGNVTGNAATATTSNALAAAGWIPPLVTVATLPVTPVDGQEVTVTDALASTDCEVGGGTFRNRCVWNDGGGAWEQAISGVSGSTQTLESVMTNGNSTTKCTEADPCQFGNGTVYINVYVTDANQMVIEPSVAADRYFTCMTDQVCGFWDTEGAAAILTIDPDAATQIGKYTFGTAYKPKKTVWVPAGALFGDGTQCPAAPSTVTINSGAPRQTFICTDNDGSSLYGEVSMPKSWDGGTVTFAHHYIQTAADTSALNGDIAASCRLTAATINNTWGTEIAIDDAAVTGSNALDITTSAAVTPNGTCTAGTDRMLQFRYQLDATGTTTAVATLHHLGFKIEYSVTSLSD